MSVDTDFNDVMQDYFDLVYESRQTAQPWWDMACEAIEKEWYRIIPSRDGNQIYLARFWLSQPFINDRGMPSARNSVLLHHFLLPDDDEHLHNHPWSGDSLIINGSYIEETFEGTGEFKKGDVNHITEDRYHKILSVAPNTWSLVNTTDKTSDWGFLVDNKFIIAKEYLETRGK